MGRIIPNLIKRQVLIDWLNGLSRDTIAFKNQISAGTVSAIIKYFRSHIPDLDLLRALVVALRKKNLELFQFARSMRLRNMLDNLELPEERIEKFLDELCVFFYKHDDKNVEEFLSQLELVSGLERQLDVSIYEIPEEIDKKRAELNELNSKLSNLNQQFIQKRHELGKIAKYIEDYWAARLSDDNSKEDL